MSDYVLNSTDIKQEGERDAGVCVCVCGRENKATYAFTSTV